jgi:hypothetical protein
VGPIVGALFLSLLSEPFGAAPADDLLLDRHALTILFLPGGLITLPGSRTAAVGSSLRAQPESGRVSARSRQPSPKR